MAQHCQNGQQSAESFAGHPAAEHSGVSAVVLAAGMSKRMGAFKPLLPVLGKTLLENVLENIGRARVDEIILVLGASAELIQTQICLDSIKVVTNEAYREGMATSLQMGLAHVASQTEAVVVALGDQPFVRPETINHLISQYRERKPQIVIPLYRGVRGNPVLIDRSVFPELMQLSGDVGCRAVFGRHPDTILKVAVDDPGVLFDLDTPGDLEKIG